MCDFDLMSVILGGMEFPNYILFTLNKSQFRARPLEAGDKTLLQKGFSKLSDKSKYLRLFQIDTKLSDFQIEYLTEIDGINHVAWGILDESGTHPIPVGVGRFIRLKDAEHIAEVAITIADSHQGRGLGRILFAILNFIAAKRSLKTLRCYVLGDNRLALKSLQKFTTSKHKVEGALAVLELDVIPNYLTVKNIPEMRSFMEAMKMVEIAMEQ